DDQWMIDGVRIFEAATSGPPDPHCRSDWPWCLEVKSFAGPAGKFFSDGSCLYSSDKNGFSRWDINEGALTGFLAGFTPPHRHPGAGEFAQLDDGMLVRCKVG